MRLSSLLRRQRKRYEWKKEWQERLSHLLESATQRLRINLVFVVAEESDPYSELLFLFSFIGVAMGSLAGLIFKVFQIDPGVDLYVFPLLGFTAFGMLHLKKSRWLRGRFQSLAEKRVALKARSYFYDYQSSQTPVLLIYLSESEQLVEILKSPDLNTDLTDEKRAALIAGFLSTFEKNNPLPAVEKLLDQIIGILSPVVKELHVSEGETGFSPPVFVPASDFDIRVVPILKGNKDIN